GKDRETRIVQADEHDEHEAALGSAGLLPVREGGLVAVMPVGDEQAAVGKGLGYAVVVQAPEPGALDLDLWRTARQVEGGLAFVEEEDRLELRTNLATEAQPSFLRPPVRPLVRENRARLVRLNLQRGDEPRAGARDA